jgi:hypothetical protein
MAILTKKQLALDAAQSALELVEDNWDILANQAVAAGGDAPTNLQQSYKDLVLLYATAQRASNEESTSILDTISQEIKDSTCQLDNDIKKMNDIAQTLNDIASIVGVLSKLLVFASM